MFFYHTGRLTGCPGYVGIVIINRWDQEELLRYDFLILCPAEFNITFRIPNLMQQQEKMFEMQLQDSIRSYAIHVARLAMDEQLPDSFNEPETEPEPEAMLLPVQQIEMSPAVFVVAAGLTVVWISVFVFIYVEKLKSQKSSRNKNFRSNQINPTAPPLTDNDITPTTSGVNINPCQGRILLKKEFGHMIKRHFCGIYVLTSVTYSLSFTFTAFYYLVVVLTRPDVEKITGLEAFQAQCKNATQELSLEIFQHGNDEMRRMEELANGMRSACDNYIGELFQAVLDEMGTVSRMTRRRNATIGTFIVEHWRDWMNAYVADLERFRINYRYKVTPVTSHVRNSIGIGDKLINHNRISRVILLKSRYR